MQGEDMASRRKVQESRIYQLKVTLRDSKPPIWRRLQVGADTSLEKLHMILQIAMECTDSHLHQFIIDNEYYSQPEFDLGDFGHKVHNEKRVELRQLRLEPKRTFAYEYDFGDSWEHEVLVEKILEREEGIYYPRCVAGKRACPPEDCGGICGYERLQK